MGSKRTATSDLNHENWDNEEAPEEKGTISLASDEVLQKRVIKAARRRLPTNSDGTTKTAFSGFTGFKTNSSSAASAFSFLASNKTTTTNQADTAPKVVPTSNGSPALSANGTEIPSKMESKPKESEITKTEGSGTKKSSDYHAKLKGLNESVAQWIKSHVDSNPFCILTPIFRDYEKYLNEMETTYGQTSKAAEQEPPAKTTSTETAKLVVKAPESQQEKPTSVSTGIGSASSIGEVKTEPSIFSNVNTKSIFGKSEKTESKSFFGNASAERNPFLSKTFGSQEEKKKPESETSEIKPTPSLSFAPSSTSSIFSFGQSSATSTASAGFSFGGGKPYSFGNVAKSEDTEETKEDDAKEDEDEPPKPDFKPVTEEGAIYEQRCKVFVKKDGNFTDRGVGTLFLKPTPNEKTQLIVRADTSCGNLLLNALLVEGIPTQRMGKNNVMMVLLPTPDAQPPPTPVLLRVKTSEEADELLEVLNKHKK